MRKKIKKYVEEEILPRYKFISKAFWTLLFLLLFIGLNHCLPMKCYTDEKVWLEPTESFWRGNFKIIYEDPVNWGHPGQSIMHLIWLASYLILPIRLIFTRRVVGIDSFAKFEMGIEKSDVYLLGRAINATFAFLTAFILYKITKGLVEKSKSKRKFISYLPPLFLCTNGLFLYYSKHVRTDIPQTFFVFLGLISIYLFLDKFPKLKMKYIFFFGLATGLALMTKWTSAIMLYAITLPFWVILSHKSPLTKKTKTLLYTVIIFTAGMFIGLQIASPSWLAYTSQIVNAINSENKEFHLGADNLNFTGNLIFYQKVLLSSFGIFIYSFFWIGVFKSLHSVTQKRNLTKSITEVFFLLFPFIYFISISTLKIHQSRWANPALPPFALVAALGFKNLTEKTKKKVYLGILAIAVITPLTKSLIYNLSFINSDTRVVALNYWNSNIRKSGATITFDGYTPFLPDGSTKICDESVDHYISSGSDYIFISSAMYSYYLAKPNIYQQCNNFYNTLFTKHNPQIVFQGNPIQTDYQTNPTYDLAFWNGIVNDYKSYFTLPLGPDILIYSLNQKTY
jgi:hypothetical protein